MGSKTQPLGKLSADEIEEMVLSSQGPHTTSDVIVFAKVMGVYQSAVEYILLNCRHRKGKKIYLPANFLLNQNQPWEEKSNWERYYLGTFRVSVSELLDDEAINEYADFLREIRLQILLKVHKFLEPLSACYHLLSVIRIIRRAKGNILSPLDCSSAERVLRNIRGSFARYKNMHNRDMPETYFSQALKKVPDPTYRAYIPSDIRTSQVQRMIAKLERMIKHTRETFPPEPKKTRPEWPGVVFRIRFD